ncbi:ROK family protein [Actinotalea sp. M2MS4P-6]|uniref:ROK family transcriptional regulator n=1 Tax=Actinotalea sp. M2MS4P-6 TaxID=2983762 RepID=UPI0021E3B013|nr:ROK family transcriptional regulator [Actinotalea sp. M2MS4P-6]MCV2394359.1 ROK family protein [Actinotalea sp. M2MS4P-6]
MSPRGSSSMRDFNRARVLDAFAGAVALTRGEIAARTGLSRTTVTGLVDQLVREGLLTTPRDALVVPRSDVPGRRPELLARTRPLGYGVAIDAGHERLQIAIADLSGRVLARGVRHIGIEATAKEAARHTRAVVRELVAAAAPGQTCHGVVAAIPEPIGRDGRVARDSVASRWHGVRPGEVLGDALGQEVHAWNDANLAVLGETVFGASRNLDDVFYVKISHGVGLGIVVNGRLVRGTDGLAGEIGHTQVRADGIVCLCGNRGCLYTLSASEYLTQALHAVTHNPELTLDNLAAMGRQGHPGAGRVLRDAGREVGHAVANLCNALNPRLVIVGGSLARAGDWAISGLRESMADRTEARVAQALEITASRLGERAEVYGAIAMAIGVIDPVTAEPRVQAARRTPA